MGIPIQATIDHPIEYVWELDGAWDMERIERERKLVPNGELHPFDAYRHGKTRFQLSIVEPWLDRSKDPVIFKLRRLTDGEYAAVVDLQRKGYTAQAEDVAFGLGVVDIVGLPFELDTAYMKDQRITSEDVERISKIFGREVKQDVGVAVVLASGDLTADEKKKYASGRGPWDQTEKASPESGSTASDASEADT